MQSKATSVSKYLNSLPPERRVALQKVRSVIKKHLPAGFKEGMEFGLIGYFIPLSTFPDTYNGHPLMIAALASQKNYMAVYLMGVYGHSPLATWFSREWKKTGKKLDMGASCIRFKKLEDVPLDVLGSEIASIPVDKLIASYEAKRPKKR